MNTSSKYIVSIAFNYGLDRDSLREVSTHRTLSGAVKSLLKVAVGNGWCPEISMVSPTGILVPVDVNEIGHRTYECINPYTREVFGTVQL